MAGTAQDLWPHDVFAEVDRDSPVAILREQAALLREHSQGLLRGEVTSSALGDAGYMVHHFDIVVPSLRDYRYTLFRVRHGAKPYPAAIECGGDEEVQEADADNAGDFRALVGATLNSDRTRRIIRTLMTQAAGDAPLEQGDSA